MVSEVRHALERLEAAGERQVLQSSLESARALGKEIAGVLAEKLAAALPPPSAPIDPYAPREAALAAVAASGPIGGATLAAMRRGGGRGGHAKRGMARREEDEAATTAPGPSSRRSSHPSVSGPSEGEMLPSEGELRGSDGEMVSQRGRGAYYLRGDGTNGEPKTTQMA